MTADFILGCKFCTEPILDKYKPRKYCSTKCYHNATRKKYLCVICGIQVFRDDGHNIRKTCSDKCYSILASKYFDKSSHGILSLKECPREQFIELMWEKASVIAIAQQFGVSRDTVYLYMKEHEIEKFDGKSIPRRLQLSEEAKSFIDGLILSDGHIVRHKLSGHVNLKTPFEEYAKYVCDKLQNYGIVSNVHKQVRKNFYLFGKFITSKVFYAVDTWSYENFLNEHNRWYIKGKTQNENKYVKIVPRDFRSNPTSWNMAYIGDGCIYKNKKRKIDTEITISTNCFTYDEVSFLKNKLNDVGIRSMIKNTERENQYVLNMHRDSKNFLKFIGDYPCDFFKYKWTDLQYIDCIDCKKSFLLKNTRTLRCEQCLLTKDIKKQCSKCRILFRVKNTKNELCYNCYRKDNGRYGYAKNMTEFLP